MRVPIKPRRRYQSGELLNQFQGGMPAGDRMEAERWASLPPGAPIDDERASGGKAVAFLRDRPGMARKFKLKRSYYATPSAPANIRA